MGSSLSLRTRVAYAAPGFAFALVGLPIYVHLPKFYSDALGVNLTVLGAVILASRAWDAVTDPAIGFLSDRLRTRAGRRRPLIAAAAVPLGLSAALLLAPPARLSPDALGWWFGALLFVAFLAWTSIQVPHAALGAELTSSDDDRTRLYAARDGLWIVGTIVAAGAPSLVRWGLGAPADGTRDREVFGILAWVYAPLLAALPLWCAWTIEEPPSSAPVTGTPWALTRDAWRNAPFRTLLAAYAVGALGAAMPATLVLFYVEHVIGAPSWAEAFLALYFLSGVAFIPFWTRLSRRVGRKRAWLWAMGVNAGAFVFAAFLGRGDTAGYALVCLVSGAGFGGGLILPNSLVADAIDYDELHSGERRDGLYFGLWSIATKLSAAAGAAAALPALAWAGYAPGLVQSPETLQVLRLLYAGVPTLCYFAGLLIAARFPIDERAHREIRAALLQRAGGAEPPAALVPGGLP